MPTPSRYTTWKADSGRLGSGREWLAIMETYQTPFLRSRSGQFDKSRIATNSPTRGYAARLFFGIDAEWLRPRCLTPPECETRSVGLAIRPSRPRTRVCGGSPTNSYCIVPASRTSSEKLRSGPELEKSKDESLPLAPLAGECCSSAGLRESSMPALMYAPSSITIPPQ